MSVDCLEHFGCLDELAQVVYQGFDRFVVLSNIEHDRWVVHLGLSGQDGRWWRGALSNVDILKVVGSKPSAKVLENFAERLADSFVQGELTIDDWSTEQGAKLKLAVGPVAKSLRIPLAELPPQEAAAHATKVLFELALQAQSRKCRLGATGSIPTAAVSASATVTELPPRISAPAVPLAAPVAVTTPTPSTSSVTKELLAQKEELKALKAALENEKRRHKSPPEPVPAAATAAARRAPKGASLANPNKKARKYQAIEFESDEE